MKRGCPCETPHVGGVLIRRPRIEDLVGGALRESFVPTDDIPSDIGALLERLNTIDGPPAR